MLWVLFIVALPFLVWLWLGVAFVVIKVTLCWVQWEIEMEQALHEVKERARLIRYMTLVVDSMPGLLSYYDEEKNILYIDGQLASSLPNMDRERLEMTEHPFTRLTAHNEIGLRFKPYAMMEMQAAQ